MPIAYKKLLAKVDGVVQKFESDSKGKNIGYNIIRTLKLAFPYVKKVEKYHSTYNFSPEVPGNGHRSFLIIFQKLLNSLSTEIDTITNKRFRLFGSIEDDFVTAMLPWANVLTFYYGGIMTIVKIHEKGSPGELFIDDKDLVLVKYLAKQQCKDIYGKCLGFIYNQELRTMLEGAAAFAATKWKQYRDKSSSSNLGELMDINKYRTNHEERAELIEDMENNVKPEFLKWLSEQPRNKLLENITKTFISFSGDSETPKTVEEIKIATKSFQLKTGNKTFTVSTPEGHNGDETLAVRFVSMNENESSDLIISLAPLQFAKLNDSMKEQADKASDEVLAKWSKITNASVVSVIFSSVDLSGDDIEKIEKNVVRKSTYLKRIDEIFFIYCWILQNFSRLKTTAKRIIIYGVSFGAAMTMALVMKLSSKQLPLPDGLFFTSAVLNENPVSASHLISFFDPIFPVKPLIPYWEKYNLKDIVSDVMISPYRMEDDIVKILPPVHFTVGSLDFALDDNVGFARRMNKLGKSVNLTVYDGMGHGFILAAKFWAAARKAAVSTDHKLRDFLNSIKK